MDSVLLYGEGADVAALSGEVARLAAEGSVIALKAVPEKLRYRRLIRFDGRGAAAGKGGAGDAATD